MYNNIAWSKKEMIAIIKDKDLTSAEKYDLVWKKYMQLNDKDKSILYRECKREEESYNMSEDTYYILNAALSGIAILVAVIAAIADATQMLPMPAGSLWGLFGSIVMVYILLAAVVGYWKKGRMTIRYLIDILEAEGGTNLNA